MGRSVIFDMDGTLEDVSERRHYALAGAWEDWHARTGEGPPNEPVVDLCRLYHGAGYSILITTGRQECFRKQTELWLTFNQVPWTAIYMRGNKDQREDSIVKLGLLEQIRRDGHDPRVAVDDRNRVVAMWRAAGLACLQVAEGDF